MIIIPLIVSTHSQDSNSTPPDFLKEMKANYTDPDLKPEAPSMSWLLDLAIYLYFLWHLVLCLGWWEDHKAVTMTILDELNLALW